MYVCIYIFTPVFQRSRKETSDKLRNVMSSYVGHYKLRFSMDCIHYGGKLCVTPLFHTLYGSTDVSNSGKSLFVKIISDNVILSSVHNESTFITRNHMIKLE